MTRCFKIPDEIESYGCLLENWFILTTEGWNYLILMDTLLITQLIEFCPQIFLDRRLAVYAQTGRAIEQNSRLGNM
jgi:hypothetical protein